MVVVLPQGGARSRFLFDWNAAACLAAPDQSLNALTGQVAQFQRFGIATAPDCNGKLQTFPHYVPAFHWARDPVTGLMTPGVLLEATATNRALYSQDLAAGWSVSGCTIIPNAIAGPDGTMTCDVLNEDASTGEHMVNQLIAGAVIPDNSMCTFAASVAPGRSEVYLGIVKKDATNVCYAAFDINLGTIIGFSGGGSRMTARIAKQPGGFYRCSMTADVGAGASNPQARVQTSVGSTIVFPGNPAIGIYLTDLQFEIGTAASSRIITGAAEGVRYFTLLRFPFNVPPSSMTVYNKLFDLGYSAMADSMPWSIGNSGVESPIYFERAGSVPNEQRDAYTLYQGVGGGTQSVGYHGPMAGVGHMQETVSQLNSNGFSATVVTGRSIDGGGPIIYGPPGAAAQIVPAFSGPLLSLGSASAYYPANISLQVFRIAAGIRSLEYMRHGGA